VRIAFEVGRAALARPLRPGSSVVIMASGAGINVGGSPRSGGYAGAKRMQMFMARYLQLASDARGLGIRFVALAPTELIAGTPIGEAAGEAYGREPGPLDPAGVARAILAVAGGEHPEAHELAVTSEGLEAI
jgi:hypothetical protein